MKNPLDTIEPDVVFTFIGGALDADIQTDQTPNMNREILLSLAPATPTLGRFFLITYLLSQITLTPSRIVF